MSDSTDDSGESRPAPQAQSFPIVGIGASAGGVGALERFFDALPDDSGLAFVVVTHLAPDHESNLDHIIQQHTSLTVREIAGGEKPEAGTVYVLPPATEVRIEDGRLQCREAVAGPERPGVIDQFFCSLADDQGERGIGVVLSGTGTDGTQGLRELKEKGAFTLVQSPDDADFEAMPRSALSTGIVDVEDTASNLAAKLSDVWKQAATTSIPEDADALSTDQREALQAIFTQLVSGTGHDFSGYKRSTVLRRIRRRMAVQRRRTLSDYAAMLRQTPDEVRALWQELLITVTGFFRDPEAFETLEERVIPTLFEGKTSEDEVRVWSVGCATGEEAYSLAMLLHEHASTLDRPPDVQVFATDPSPEAVKVARDATYPDSIVAGVSPERRSRYLEPRGSEYVVRRELRDMILFAEHNVLGDPPFSRIDLLVCRNVLIYLKRDLHEPVLRLFHYALRPEGVLFIGRSESVSAAPNLFAALPETSFLYQRQPAPERSRHEAPPFPLSASTPPLQMSGRTAEEERTVPPSLRELHQRALMSHAASLVVDQNREILHLTKSASRFLRYNEGEASLDVLEAVPKEIGIELRGALHRAFQNNVAPDPKIIQTEIDGEPMYVTVQVYPLGDMQGGNRKAQVFLTETVQPVQGEDGGSGAASEEHVDQLKTELHHTKEQLRTTVEEYETTTEELESSNEELLSMYEELQSKNEELETSQEELQSVNEELKTTNEELKAKVEELQRANSDLENLMQATNVATLFLDRDLCIEWFTPEVQEHFNIVPSDRGRSLADFAIPFEYNRLLEDAREVLDSLQAMEQEIQTEGGQWFLLRIRPYQNVEDKIDGVVLTFVDITERRRAEIEVREERNFVESLLNTVGALIVVLDPEGRIVRFNEKCESVTGRAEEDVKGASVVDRFVHPEEEAEVRDVYQQLLEDGAPIHHEHHWQTSEGTVRLIRWSYTTLNEENGSVAYIIGTGLDITRRRRLEREVIAISDQTQQRIGQELHDLLASQLSGTAMMLKRIVQKIDTGEEVSVDEIDEIAGIVKDAGEQARVLSHSLMPLETHGEGLVDGLEDLVHRQEKMSGIACSLEVHGSIPPLSEDIVSHLYRIALEAVRNAVQHADPEHITVRLESDDNRITLEVQDDGTGIPEGVPESGHYGLNIMQYRADLIEAQLTVEPLEDGGTLVQCHLPRGQITL